MTQGKSVLAVIPARGGSVGLPNKNIRPFLGLPLIAHSILFARGCPEIHRTIVSTDSEEIVAIAREFGAEVPFLRPSALAEHSTPMWPVVRHALSEVERVGKINYQYVILLDPTSPGRDPSDIGVALSRLVGSAVADGIVSISRPYFNPVWHCVVERQGIMADLFDEGRLYSRRQDIPDVYRINGALYIWKAEFVRREERGWRGYGNHLMYEIPEIQAMSIDSLEEFQHAEALVKCGLVRFSWLGEKAAFP